MNIKHWILLAVMLVLITGCGRAPEMDERRETPAPDETSAPTPTAAREGVTILADGVVQTGQPALPLAFEIGGKLLRVQVRAGDQVQAGDVIAQLEEAEPVDSYQAAVASAELSVLKAQQALDDLYTNAEIARTNALNDIATYAQAVRDAQYQLENYILPTHLQGLDIIEALDLMKTQLDAASQAFEPYRYLSPDNTTRHERLVTLNEAQSQYDAAVKRLRYEYELQVAQANLDKARREYDEYTAGPSSDDLALAEAERANAQADLALAKKDLEKAIEAQDDVFLVAPWTGTVLSVEAAPGALVSSGSPIVTLLDTTQMEFHTTNLSERDLALIQPGQKAIVTLKAYPDDPLEAAVMRIGWQVGESVGDAATFPVMLSLSQTKLDIRPGMTGRVEILFEE
jgi:HlyD family secretion protein